MSFSFLFPQVNEIIEQNDFYKMGELLTVNISENHAKIMKTACKLFDCKKLEIKSNNADIRIEKHCELSKESYTIKISEKEIVIGYSENNGLFYAFLTLCSIINHYENKIPCVELKDNPCMKIRGFLLDISRGKVPTLKTLKQIADNMAKCKMNHLQLYVEGYSFAYPQYKNLWENQTPITMSEMIEFNEYCNERFIELVPCQNSLGHMGKWLENNQLKCLAECENGFSVLGHNFPPTTLDVKSNDSIQFVKSLLDSLIPCFSSDYCNCCLDEPFELAAGKNADNKNKKYELYTEYANKLSAYIKSKNMKIMMWGDIIRKDDSILNNLDKDIMILEWGYEKEYPFDERAQILENNKRSFCVCPGTSSWLSITGITDNMLENIRNAAAAAIKYSAEGIIVTDWGDMGHLQYLPISWAGMLTAASYSWSGMRFSENVLENALNTLIFKDENRLMGKILLEAGRYIQYEEHRLPCRSLAFAALSCGFVTKEEYLKHIGFYNITMPYFSPDVICSAYEKEFCNAGKVNHFDFNGLTAHFDNLEQMLQKSDMQCDDSKLIKAELLNSFNLVRSLSELRHAIYIAEKPAELADKFEQYKLNHIKLWKARNKSYDCLDSLTDINKTIKSLCVKN